MASFPTPKRIPFSSQVFPILLEQLENPFMSSAEGMHKPVGCTSVISRPSNGKKIKDKYGSAFRITRGAST